MPIKPKFILDIVPRDQDSLEALTEYIKENGEWEDGNCQIIITAELLEKYLSGESQHLQAIYIFDEDATISEMREYMADNAWAKEIEEKGLDRDEVL